MFRVFYIILIFSVLYSCKKPKVELYTTIITELTSTSFSSGGEVTKDGGEEITVKGICWSTNSEPVLGKNNFTKDGSGLGSYSSEAIGLQPNKTYYVRAYATNNNGTFYGNQYQVTTPPLISTTVPIVYIYPNTFNDTINRTTKLNGEIMHQGGNDVSEQGFVWGTKMGVSISDNKLTHSSKGLGKYSSTFNFQIGVTYYCKAYAINSFGISYSDEISITIKNAQCKVKTIEVVDIDSTIATCKSAVTNGGGDAVSSRGVCWATYSNPTINDFKTSDGSGLGSFSSTLTGLLPNTVYYCRSYAINSEGVAYGNEITFTTLVSKLFIGMEYKGGIIFYISPLKDGGLVISTSDLSKQYSWGCLGLDISEANNRLAGSGESNSQAILQNCSESSAAKLCDTYVSGKYDDWYLPSLDELGLVYTNLKVKNNIKFASNYYWSSTQKNANIAYTYGFVGGNIGEVDKSTLKYVRAIRKF
jgi:hypothetical protein